MYSTTVYLYQQITKVLLVDTSGGYFTARYDPVYAKSLTINKGVDNVLLFEFINQEQKPVNITGSEFVFRLLDQSGTILLLEKPMTTLSASLGRVKVTLDSSDTLGINAQPASYSIERASGSYRQAAYVNADSAARGDANVVDSVKPQHLLSNVLTIPAINGTNNQGVNNPNNPPVQTNNTFQPSLYYSSEIVSPPYLTTVQAYLDCYTGTIKFEGLTELGLAWQNASETYDYMAFTGWIYYTVTGNWAYLRMAFNNRIGSGASANATVNPQGVVTAISIANQGQNYPAPPRIRIVGNGSGARAISTLASGGGVGGITLLDGGAGYTALTLNNTPQAYVIIDGGAVTNISWR